MIPISAHICFGIEIHGAPVGSEIAVGELEDCFDGDELFGFEDEEGYELEVVDGHF